MRNINGLSPYWVHVKSTWLCKDLSPCTGPVLVKNRSVRDKSPCVESPKKPPKLAIFVQLKVNTSSLEQK